VLTRGTDPREAPLRHRLATPLAGLADLADGRGAHVDPELVAAHAAGELPPDEALAVGRHLAACDDGRCLAALRAAVSGMARAGDALYGPRREEHTDPSIGVPWGVTFKSAPPPPRAHEQARERNTPTLQRSYLPRAPPSSRRSPLPGPVAAGRLSIVVEGTLYEVNKDRFVVGRGTRGSDLAIDDPGVSRQHALIEHAGGSYYLVDMGSTNGVEYQGERVARRQIAHGDRFRICDHELTFLLG
jgi:hypothetical protein